MADDLENKLKVWMINYASLEFQKTVEVYAQIIHVGRVAHSDTLEQIASGEVAGLRTFTDACPAWWYQGGINKFGFLTVEINDPRKFIEEFRHGAINAKKAGLDGVEGDSSRTPGVSVLGPSLANTLVLLLLLVDNTVNKRSDKWAASMENRARFGLEVLKAVTSVFDPGPVDIKLTPAGSN
ncbi:hypothetical protein D9758_008403 [Tetrapyrgos nigripes]|uniref:NADH:flavin oxidoreductase/NADH oxidase N-terminal domain-containing protein n=1 Tax=Tetrapyrgos nigripes TaxID=182062 RepID=A0A8H5LMN3_9AGAR|nr:hypothetical protein D9758_008403 [Tetrapyrgos nigripes]